jgi:cyclopropane fatty-acyl-phospholipid synthase-like methyltransferase
MISSVSQLQEYWEKAYESTATPFDAQAPDEWIAALAESGKIHGNVLDAGCGPGRTSLYLAELGYSVLGVDFSVNAIQRAKRRAVERRSDAQFLQADMSEFSGYVNHFDTVVDIGCFHSLHDHDRGAYAGALHGACRSGAAIYLRAFSDKNSKENRQPDGAELSDLARGEGIPALSEDEIRDAFTLNGWVVKELVEREIELFLAVDEEKPKTYCWFAEMRREP